MSNILEEIIKKIDETNRKMVEKYIPFLEGYHNGKPVRDCQPPINPLPLLKDFFLIAECKKASPSKGIIREPFEPATIATSYVAGGASAISVLVEEHYFQGSEEHLRQVRAAVNVPILWKDFVIDPVQVLRAYHAGADMVLMIARLFEEEEDLYLALLEMLVDLKLTPIIEVFNLDEIKFTLELIGDKKHLMESMVLGVNNRDLTSFEVEIDKSLEARNYLKANQINLPLISESGISSFQEISFLKENGFAGALVGESLLRQVDIEKATQELLIGE